MNCKKKKKDFLNHPVFLILHTIFYFGNLKKKTLTNKTTKNNLHLQHLNKIKQITLLILLILLKNN